MIDMAHLFKMTPIGQMLLAGGMFLSVVLIAFRNMGLLPIGTGDFVFFAVLAVCIAAYRPGWVFLLLVMSLPLETVNLAPLDLGIEFRPYQFLEVALVSGLLIRLLARRALPEIPRPTLPDALLLLVPIGSLPALVNAPSGALSFKLSLVLLSMYGLYVLARMYVRSLDDVRKVLPFVLVSGAIVLCYAFLQNIRFLYGLDPFQAMPGRPDGGFPEPDWLGAYLIFLGAIFFSMFTRICRSRFSEDRTGYLVSFFMGVASFTFLFTALLMTVARSAWIGMFVAGVVSVGLFVLVRRDTKDVSAYLGGLSVAVLLSLAFVIFVPLTRFDIFERATSTAGFQEITVSCDAGSALSGELPERISDVSELESYGCHHIDLEEIGIEETNGNSVTTTLRPDPSIGIRKDIYGLSFAEIGKHPVLGIGWGSISQVLGTDDRGAGLNASNVFLEVWLGSGLLGLVGFVGFLALILIRALRTFFHARAKDDSSHDDIAFPVFVLSVVSGLIVFNLFNAGILLGFLWVLFAALLASEDR